MTRFGSWRWAGSVNMPWWLVPSSPTSPARSTAMSDRLVVLADVVDGLVEGPLEERRVERDDRPHARPSPARWRASSRAARRSRRRTTGRGTRPGTCDSPVPVGMPGGDRDDPPVGPGELDELGGEDRGVVRVLLRRVGDARRAAPRRRPSTRSASARRRGRRRRRRRRRRRGDRHRRQRRAVEPDLVGLGRPVAAALLGPDVDDRRAGQRRAPGRASRAARGGRGPARAPM